MLGNRGTRTSSPYLGSRPRGARRAVGSLLAIVLLVVAAGCKESVPDGRASEAGDPAAVRARLDEVYAITRAEGPTGTSTVVDEVTDVTGQGFFQHDPVAEHVVIEVDGVPDGEGILFADRGYTRPYLGAWTSAGRSIDSPRGAAGVPAEVLRMLVATEVVPEVIEAGEQNGYEGYRWRLTADVAGFPEYEQAATRVDLEVDDVGRVARVSFHLDPLSSLDDAPGHADHDHDEDLTGGTTTYHFDFEDIDPITPPI